MATVSATDIFADDHSSSVDSIQKPNVGLHQSAQVQKAKGGRKPIYATLEERKQRNRQAQAAFRNRRTGYIEQLETTIKHQEDALQSLQQCHCATDQCCMLRYENSLLEEILREKGIDVQAELQVKTESPHLRSITAAPGQLIPQQPNQRANSNRHNQAQRSASGIMSHVKTNNSAPQSFYELSIGDRSPQLHSTSPLKTSSSSTSSRSPNITAQHEHTHQQHNTLTPFLQQELQVPMTIFDFPGPGNINNWSTRARAKCYYCYFI